MLNSFRNNNKGDLPFLALLLLLALSSAVVSTTWSVIAGFVCVFGAFEAAICVGGSDTFAGGVGAVVGAVFGVDVGGKIVDRVDGFTGINVGFNFGVVNLNGREVDRVGGVDVVVAVVDVVVDDADDDVIVILVVVLVDVVLGVVFGIILVVVVVVIVVFGVVILVVDIVVDVDGSVCVPSTRHTRK